MRDVRQNMSNLTINIPVLSKVLFVGLCGAHLSLISLLIAAEFGADFSFRSFVFYITSWLALIPASLLIKKQSRRLMQLGLILIVVSIATVILTAKNGLH